MLAVAAVAVLGSAQVRLRPWRHRAARTPAVTIRVAQFNCDISDEFPIIKASLVARAIRASGADVVGIEEGGGEIPQIAHALGWRYYDIRMQIVSRLPLVDPPDGQRPLHLRRGLARAGSSRWRTCICPRRRTGPCG